MSSEQSGEIKKAAGMRPEPSSTEILGVATIDSSLIADLGRRSGVRGWFKCDSSDSVR